ncbi:hypothetical protein [Noviherbaspirillum galbum]|uniref:Uncharacterized protein n=1 Tax=Noviherbaspirillum galbum TaxID=2709383 RepID=A0A6B3SRP4_9BURK|nr:hypothetical protein [Noviherbaspirillum galbum]NEX63413.1 hypothetical protein [Noviherbaspirillum galbum]
MESQKFMSAPASLALAIEIMCVALCMVAAWDMAGDVVLPSKMVMVRTFLMAAIPLSFVPTLIDNVQGKNHNFNRVVAKLERLMAR